MGKRTRSQRRGSSPKNRVASHRFPAANSLPRVSEQMAEVVDLVHSPAHTAPLAKIRFEDGSVGHMGAPDGIASVRNSPFLLRSASDQVTLQC